jgi:Zn-dependent M28 family amino/carboxypeptidase
MLEPRGQATRQLIISAHHDAAREFRFLRGNQKLYGLKILIPDVFCMLSCLVAWINWGSQVFTYRLPGFTHLSNFVLIIGVYFVFTKFFLFTDNVSPGAGDNLIASTMLVELAKCFRDPLKSGHSFLQQTRLIFISFDAEEAGLRGSRAWVREHKEELQSLPTLALNIDNIYNLKDLGFLVSDLNDHITLDRSLVDRCLLIARELGYPSRTCNMPFGGGGTDAAELARVGVRATTMLAMPTDLVREGMVYHTMQDTVDKIEVEAVRACLKIAEKLALEVDAEPM